MSADQPKEREVICPYCGLNAELTDSILVYRKSYGKIWICQPCEAWVGVHSGSKGNRPKGTLAKIKLRKMRMEGHKLFDPIWRKRVADGEPKKAARKATYKELAARMGIHYNDCHFAMFDEERCAKALEVLRTWREATTEAAASGDDEE